MSKFLLSIKWLVGAITALGTVITVWLSYLRGKKDHKSEVIRETYDVLKKEEAIEAKPRPRSSDDRNSLRGGDF
jgi:hypothetical protein